MTAADISAASSPACPTCGGSEVGEIERPAPLYCNECGRYIPPETPSEELTFDLARPDCWFHASCARRIDPGDKLPANRTERECGRFLVGLGIKPHRRGYPDFWWVDDEGRLCFAEVKPSFSQRLSREQLAFFTAAQGNGCRVFRYDPIRGLQEVPA